MGLPYKWGFACRCQHPPLKIAVNTMSSTMSAINAPGIGSPKRGGTEQADDDEGDEESQHYLSLPVVFDSFTPPV